MQSKIFRRIDNLQALLKKAKVDGVVINDPVNLYYYTLGQFTTGLLVVTKTNAHLVLDTRYLDAWKKQKIFATHSITEFHWNQIFKKPSVLFFDSNQMSINALKKLKAIKKSQAVTFKSAEKLLNQLRVVKEHSEIQKMQTAANIAEEAYLVGAHCLKSGITELEVVHKIELFFLEKYGVKPSFPPIVAFGKNSAIPHHTPGNTKLKKNELVLIDLGCIVEKYCSDTTKIIFFGKVPKRFFDLFNQVYEAKEAALKLCKEGKRICDLDIAARKVFKKHKMEQHFLHSLGHGVGLDIHEDPYLNGKNRTILQKGSVVTIEPGLYLPNMGGIRLEDQVVVGTNGPKLLTKKLKKPLIIS